MKCVLLAAAGYNLIWGGWVVLFPSIGFELAGLSPTHAIAADGIFRMHSRVDFRREWSFSLGSSGFVAVR